MTNFYLSDIEVKTLLRYIHISLVSIERDINTLIDERKREISFFDEDNDDYFKPIYDDYFEGTKEDYIDTYDEYNIKYSLPEDPRLTELTQYIERVIKINKYILQFRDNSEYTLSQYFKDVKSIDIDNLVITRVMKEVKYSLYIRKNTSSTPMLQEFVRNWKSIIDVENKLYDYTELKDN